MIQYSQTASIYPENYPEEYIRGFVTFFGRDFVVTPDVLIPRLETESLVRRARQILSRDTSTSRHPTTVIDIGCGSGIIGTSLADLADEVIFLDISVEALRVAEKNFRTHFPYKKAEFILSDLLSNIPTLEHSNILFVTNLPYIRDEDWIHMSADTIHEPKFALFGGEQTGFELYEKLFEQLSAPSRNHPLSAICLFEFGFDQREIAESIVKKYPQWEYSFFADYAGVERFGEMRFIY